MYINYLSDRKELGYKCLIDTECSNRLVVITDAGVFVVNNVRLKVVRKTKRVVLYGKFIYSILNGLSPSHAVGLPIFIQRNPPAIIKVGQSNGGLPKKVIISHIKENTPVDIDLTEREVDQLYDFSIECIHNSLSQEELISKITNLRGGFTLYDVIGLVALVAGLIIMLGNSGYGFQPNQNAVIPPHLQWVYGEHQFGNYFGYGNNYFGYGNGSDGKLAGPKSVTVTGMIQSAGSDKKDPSSGYYDYIDIMNKLHAQRGKRSIEIQVGDQFYRIKNPNRDYAEELGDALAEKIYDSIRECDTDICDIAENLGFKANNIKKVKDHVFYNEHTLDRYGPNEIEHKRFDADLPQALAWKRLETGIHTLDDVEWIKHECAERYYELKYGSGYTEAHDFAQSRYNGKPWAIWAPWEDKNIF